MNSNQACPTVPPLYTWDSGTKGVGRDSERDKLGTSSLKSLALAVLAVPPERDKRDKGWDKGKNLVPQGQEALGQKIPQKEKVSLEKYDHPRHAPSAIQTPWEAHWRTVCPDYWQGCLTCLDASLVHRSGPMAGALNSNFCRRHAPPSWARERVQGVLQ